MPNPNLFQPSLLPQLLTAGLAYLDPGSGSFILQLLIATILGGAFIVKAYWKKIVGFFRSRFSRRGDDQQE